MRLSKRIYALAEAVPDGYTAADIGTDHGYVPMLLMRQCKTDRVIMSDISEASLAKARETFDACGIEIPQGDFRTGDGLDTIGSAETDCVIIAGLGGHTITDILSKDIDKSRSFKCLVLQPRKHSGALRHFLYTHGWDITSERLASEGKFECEIITAAPSGEDAREALYPADDIRWKYPEELMSSDTESAALRIGWKIKSVSGQIENMAHSKNDRDAEIKRLMEDLDYLKGLIADLQA